MTSPHINITELIQHKKNTEFEEFLNRNFERINFNEKLYDIAVFYSNYEGIKLLCRYDIREAEVVFNDLLNILENRIRDENYNNGIKSVFFNDKFPFSKILFNERIFENNIVYKLYNSGFLSSKKLKYIVRSNFKISSSLICKLILNNELKLMEVIWRFFLSFSTNFIIKLLCINKECKGINNKTLNNLILNGKNRLNINKDWDVYTPFIYAYSKRNNTMMKYLIDLKTDINKEIIYGDTFWFQALDLKSFRHQNNIIFIKYLIEQGEDINKENKNGDTALIKACCLNRLDIIKYLIDHGADINKENNDGDTPLIKACHNGNSSVVKYLIEHGADLTKGNKNGDKPLNIAYKTKNKIILNILDNSIAIIHKRKQSSSKNLENSINNNNSNNNNKKKKKTTVK